MSSNFDVLVEKILKKKKKKKSLAFSGKKSARSNLNMGPVQSSAPTFEFGKRSEGYC